MPDKVMKAGELKFAEDTLRECAEILRERNQPAAAAVSLQALSKCLLELGKYGEASNTFEDSLKFYELAEFSEAEFRHSMFQKNTREFFDLRQRLYSDKDHISIPRMLHHHAHRMAGECDLEEAEQHHRSSLAMKRRLIDKTGDDFSIQLTLFQLAGVMRDKHQLEESEKLYRECLVIYRRL